MAIKRVRVNLGIQGYLSLSKPNDTISRGGVIRTGTLRTGRVYMDLVTVLDGVLQGGIELTYLSEKTMTLVGVKYNNVDEVWLGSSGIPFTRVYGEQFIVPNGTASQFLKADGSLDGNAYALHADLNSVKNNAWKLNIANPECETVVITLQQGQGIFEAMAKAGIDYSQSRNIYIDLSEVSSIGGTNIIDNLFSGYENLPVGVRYHIFFGNVQSSVKIYWLKPIESNIPYRVVGLTSDYPTAKCEFLRVTTDWTYADWEAAINQVDFSLDTGTLDEKENATLQSYFEKNGISFEKTNAGSLANIGSILAALASGK